MLKNILLPSHLWFAGALLIAIPAVAQAPVPSSEFWEYFNEYGDENGDSLDPLEYDQILSMKDTDETISKNSELAGQSESIDSSEPSDKPKVRNADMKFEKKSSAQASSAAVKGAAL